MLDGGDHEVADLISSDPGRGCHEAHGFAVAAVQREGDAHAFAVIAGHLEAIGTPSQVRPGDGDAAVGATLGPTSMALEQEAVPLHYRVHALMVRGLPDFRTGSAAEDRPHPAVAVGRQIGDNALISPTRSSSGCGRRPTSFLSACFARSARFERATPM